MPFFPNTELEVGVIGADVVTSTEHPFHHQCNAHGIEETEVFGNPVFRGKDVLGFQSSSMDNVPVQDYQQEEAAQEHVAQVTEYVVEGTQDTQGVSTEEVVVADILVASDVDNCLVGDNQLDHRQSIKHSNGNDVPKINLILFADNSSVLPGQI